ncbi:MAG: hypothetical protein QOI80_3023 [Solirubrobacteraceae bacterium]|jgi:hypothetical protein|nr:hypothetical protein [Solirubrobacteraceae bacterium]
MNTSPKIAALITAASFALPAVASAHPITFGHRLDHEPSNSAPAHNCKEDGSDDITPACVRIANDADGGGAVAAGMVAPRNGVIKKFKIRAGAPGEVTFVVVKRKAGDFAKVVRTGPTVQVQGLGFEELESNAVETFKANVKIKKGQYVGIRSTSTSALYCSHGGPSQLIYSGLGANYMSPTTDDGCELLVGAVLRKKQ